MAQVLKSASSRTIIADLPPSSRNTFLMVSLAAAMILRPVAVDPVKVTTSTSGLVVSGDADRGVGGADHVDDAGRDVGVLGDHLAERQRGQRGVGGGLEHDRAAGGQRRTQLGHRQLVGIVVGDDRRDHAGGFLLHPAAVALSTALDLAELLGHRIGLQQVGVVADDPDRIVELRPFGQGLGGADLGDGQRTQFVAVLDERLVQLIHAPDAQLDVRRPVRGVESLAGGRDRLLGVGDARVGRVADDVTVGGVHRGVRLRRHRQADRRSTCADRTSGPPSHLDPRRLPLCPALAFTYSSSWG